MAVKLPDETALGGLPSSRSGAIIPSYDVSAIGEGLARLGGNIAAASVELNKAWTADQSNKAYLSYLQFKAGEETTYQTSTDKIQPGTGAQGFAQNYVTGYRQRATDWLNSLPSEFRGDYAPKIFMDGDAISRDAISVEHGQIKQTASDAFKATMEGAILPRAKRAAGLPDSDPRKAELLAEIEADTLKAIDDNPYYTEVEKDALRKAARTDVQTAFAMALSPAERMDVDPARQDQTIADRIAAIEGVSKNPSSSATGTGQFISGTWRDMIRRYHPELAAGRSNEEIDALRVDPQLGQEMIDRYAAENTAILTNGGFQASPGNLYLAHFLGPGGAMAMLSASPLVDAAKINPAAAKSNPNVFYEPDGTPRSVGAVIAWAGQKMGGVVRTNWNKTLDALPYAQKVAIAADGGTQYIKQQTEIKKAQQDSYNAWKNAVDNGIKDGIIGLADINRFYSSGQLTDAGDRQHFIDAIEKRDKDTLNLASAQAKLSDPGYKWNRFADGDKKAVNLVWDNVQKQEGGSVLDDQQGDTPGMQDALAAVVRQTGIIPDGAADQIRNGIYSPDGHAQDRAFLLMDALEHANRPAYEATFDNAQRARADIYQSLVPMVPRDVLQKMLDPMDEQAAQMREKLLPKGRELAAKIGDGDILNSAFGSGLPIPFIRQIPSAPGDPLEMAALRNDFNEAYAAVYAYVRNEDEAKKLAFKWLGNKWGVTDVGSGGPTVMARPPEKYYPTVEGTHHWLDEQLQSLVQEYEPKATDWWVMPLSGGQTETEAAAGQLPAYAVMIRDENGGIRPMIDDAASAVAGKAVPYALRFNHELAVQQMQADFAERNRAAVQRELGIDIIPEWAKRQGVTKTGKDVFANPPVNIDQPLRQGAAAAGDFGNWLLFGNPSNAKPTDAESVGGRPGEGTVGDPSNPTGEPVISPAPEFFKLTPEIIDGMVEKLRKGGASEKYVNDYRAVLEEQMAGQNGSDVKMAEPAARADNRTGLFNYPPPSSVKATPTAKKKETLRIFKEAIDTKGANSPFADSSVDGYKPYDAKYMADWFADTFGRNVTPESLTPEMVQAAFDRAESAKQLEKIREYLLFFGDLSAALGAASAVKGQ